MTHSRKKIANRVPPELQVKYLQQGFCVKFGNCVVCLIRDFLLLLEKFCSSSYLMDLICHK
jgi:hypothetical protein